MEYLVWCEGLVASRDVVHPQTWGRKRVVNYRVVTPLFHLHDNILHIHHGVELSAARLTRLDRMPIPYAPVM